MNYEYVRLALGIVALVISVLALQDAHQAYKEIREYKEEMERRRW